MKIGWGTGIFLFYTVFVLSLLWQLKISREYDHSLVVDAYYEKDLNYQTHLNKMTNSQALRNQLKVKNHQQSDGQLLVQFPSGFESIEGTIQFFRPNDKSQDFKVAIQLGEDNVQRVKAEKMVPGLWKVKVDWQAGDSAFYDEISIVL